MRAAILCAIATLSFVVACPPTPPPKAKPLPFDSAEDLEKGCGVACVRLVELGCPEGSPRGPQSCSEICVVAYDARALPLKCWAEAVDAATARACGALDCKSE